MGESNAACTRTFPRWVRASLPSNWFGSGWATVFLENNPKNICSFVRPHSHVRRKVCTRPKRSPKDIALNTNCLYYTLSVHRSSLFLWTTPLQLFLKLCILMSFLLKRDQCTVPNISSLCTNNICPRYIFRLVVRFMPASSYPKKFVITLKITIEIVFLAETLDDRLQCRPTPS